MGSELPAFELVPPGRMRDMLVDAVLRGVKTATSRMQVMDQMAGIEPETPGTRMSLMDSDRNPVATIVIRSVRHLPLSDVGDDVALAEGDWFDGVAAWREAHERFWSKYVQPARDYLDNPEWAIGDDTMVTVRFFDVKQPPSPA